MKERLKITKDYINFLIKMSKEVNYHEDFNNLNIKKRFKIKKNNRCFIDVDFYLLKIQRNKYYWMNMKMELL